ncbi:polysaccharide lyase 8 family protein [Streptomyces sp. NBC_01433]|uniref:polysaccharide lyase 8 family protein n=1 Tax=Streptomyces sp. NBC_01433 TaxID=2903864 RepID=UPI002250D103|nr:polysaccharide lyase 8 family protein [Streptomyces sp. NBC_01433]MCX4674025.1 polysaccharide lyase 8 family protein [Streptomyces sp. NBC_01433]
MPGPAHAAGPSPAPDDTEFDTLRLRWTGLALGTGYDAAAEPYASRLAATGASAAGFRTSMSPAPHSLWPGLTFDPPSGITQSYSRLWTMTRAYAQPGTGHTGDAGLLADVVRGLDHLGATVYNPSTTRYGNWWEWQIGSPRLLMDIVAVLHDHLTEEQRQAACAAVDHFIPDAMLRDYSGTSTGANRVDLCRSVALRGILGRQTAKTALARDALSPVFPYVTKGDGLYADGSFVQHTWVAYSGTYGQVMLDGLGRLFALLAGSTWEVTDPGRQTILDSVEHAYAPLILNGLAMDSVNGRAISRGLLKGDERRVLRSDHFHGQGLIAAIALLAGGASAAERDRWNGMIKGWIERDTTSPILAAPQFDIADLARLHAAAAASVPAAPEPVGHTLFAAMDRAVHRRPGWAANIAMSSERISSYECGNGENPRAWHTGAGMLYWWPGTERGDQYTDWFWPTVDWYRLPGITVSTKRLADRAGGEWGEPRPAVRWTGGAHDGEFAAVGQHVKGLGSTLEARKSWFCAADAVICLGAGITATDGVPVETVVDNRNLGPDGDAHPFTLDGRDRPRWAHLEGHGGWVLPGGAALRTLREARTGAWADINTTSSTARETRHWQTLWLDHGTDPAGADYVYLLMPGADRRTVAARGADRGWLKVLANTAAAQAVAVRSLGLTAANFWQPGAAGPLSATGPASVLVRQGRHSTTLCVSGPDRSGAPVDVAWDRPVRTVVRTDPGIEVRAMGNRLVLRASPGTEGATLRCEVR